MMIDVASAFSPYPSGRVLTDGQHNGERFRSEFLAPALRAALKSGEKVIVDIDGVRSFGSSFLEEAFGGLVRLGLFTNAELAQFLEIRCTKPHLTFFRDTIQSYIDSARPQRAAG